VIILNSLVNWASSPQPRSDLVSSRNEDIANTQISQKKASPKIQSKTRKSRVTFARHSLRDNKSSQYESILFITKTGSGVQIGMMCNKVTYRKLNSFSLPSPPLFLPAILNETLSAETRFLSYFVLEVTNVKTRVHSFNAALIFRIPALSLNYCLASLPILCISSLINKSSMQTLFIYWWNTPTSAESARRTITFVTPTRL